VAKVLLINPLVREQDDPRHVPYGMALLAAIAIEKGHQIQVYDANAWRKGPEVLEQVLKADKWDIIGIGGITTAYSSIKQIVQHSRKVCPDTLIILGGGVLTSLPHEMMQFLPQVDIGVIGEAFETFPEILEMLDQGKTNWSSIDGTISRSQEDKLIVSRQRELIPDLDVLPYPAWDLFPIEEIYFPNSQVLFSEEGMLAKRRLDINASYGCSLICRYCYHLGIAGDMRYEEQTLDDKNKTISIAFDHPGDHSRTIRYHSPEYIVGLVKHAYDKYNIDFITFLDENLMTMDQYSKRTWLKRIGELWIESGLQPTCIKNNVEPFRTRIRCGKKRFYNYPQLFPGLHILIYRLKIFIWKTYHLVGDRTNARL